MVGSSPEQSWSFKDRLAEDEIYPGDEKDICPKVDTSFPKSDDAYHPGTTSSEVVKVDVQLRKEILEGHQVQPGDSAGKKLECQHLQAQLDGNAGNLKSQELTKSIDQTEQLTDELDGTLGRQKLVTCQIANMDGPTGKSSCSTTVIPDVNVGNEYGIQEIATANVSALNMERMINRRCSSHEERSGSVSFRAWLNNPSRVIDTVESLHIFKQITSFVELAHSQGVVLRNVRPSSFLLSSTSQVSIIESASSDTSSGSSAESTGRATIPALADATNQSGNKVVGSSMENSFTLASSSSPKGDCGSQKEKLNSPIEHSGRFRSEYAGAEDERPVSEGEGYKSLTSSSTDHEGLQVEELKFPLKQVLSLESIWYSSPEEVNGGTGDFPSDVYSLGVLFVELFHKAASQGEWSRAMSDLRHRLLPPSFLLEHPKLAAFCLLLLHPSPHCRPKAREILHADIFNEVEDKLAEREAIMNLEEKLTEAETTLDFLLQMEQEKHIFIQELARELNSLNDDIREVEKWQALLMTNRRWGESSKQITLPVREGFDARYGQDGPDSRIQELLLAKSAQLMKSFTTLKEAYLPAIKEYDSGRQPLEWKKPGMPSFLSCISSSTTGHGHSGGRLGSFFDDLCKFFKYKKLDIKATLQYGDILNTKNMVCSLSFDCEDEFFATAGVSRRIKIFQCNTLLEGFNEMHYPVAEMNSTSKLSCVCWHRFQKPYLASSDLEGAVQLWDVTSSQTILDLKEHGRCAWSVDFSHSDPSRLASGSDDRCVKLWSTNQGTSVGTIKTKANVCCVQFSPDHSHLLAFASADSQIYFHDLRYTRIPVSTLTGHQKTVSFLRFSGPSSVVSASTDNTLKLWDLSKVSRKAKGHTTSLGSRSDCVTTYRGHTNVKNFVGLSVMQGSYIACGSETNEVFVYHTSFPTVMLSHKFGNTNPILGQDFEDIGDKFVSSVCWKGNSQVLVTANSVGNIQVLEML